MDNLCTQMSISKIIIISGLLIEEIEPGIVGFYRIQYLFRGAGLAQWWEHSPSTNVSRVWLVDSASYVGCQFVGSLLCSERFFSGYSGFPLSVKTKIWFDLIWEL